MRKLFFFLPILIRLRNETKYSREKEVGRQGKHFDCMCYYHGLDRLGALYICSIKPRAHSAM